MPTISFKVQLEHTQTSYTAVTVASSDTSKENSSSGHRRLTHVVCPSSRLFYDFLTCNFTGASSIIFIGTPQNSQPFLKKLFLRQNTYNGWVLFVYTQAVTMQMSASLPVIQTHFLLREKKCFYVMNHLILIQLLQTVQIVFKKCVFFPLTKERKPRPHSDNLCERCLKSTYESQTTCT